MRVEEKVAGAKTEGGRADTMKRRGIVKSNRGERAEDKRMDRMW